MHTTHKHHAIKIGVNKLTISGQHLNTTLHGGSIKDAKDLISEAIVDNRAEAEHQYEMRQQELAAKRTDNAIHQGRLVALSDLL